MKKLIFLFIILAILPFSSAACINSADDYAVEVFLNKPGIDYNLNLLNNADNVIIDNGKYILQSENSPSLATILESQPGISTSKLSLSVRLQLPVKSEEKPFPILKFVSTNLKGTLNLSAEEYNGWKISCKEGTPIPQCIFKKSPVEISASLASNSRYEATITINKDLAQCSPACDGKCVSATNPKCIDSQLSKDIENILKYSGLADSFNELTSSYRVISSSDIQAISLSPETSADIDWKSALSQELEYLKSKNIISISESDIKKISILARQGSAGVNSRIAYGANSEGNDEWTYYDKTRFCIQIETQNCNEFPSSSIPAGFLVFNGSKTISAYYLIPIIMSASFLLLFIFLLVIARLVDRANSKKHIK